VVAGRNFGRLITVNGAHKRHENRDHCFPDMLLGVVDEVLETRFAAHDEDRLDPVKLRRRDPQCRAAQWGGVRLSLETRPTLRIVSLSYIRRAMIYAIQNDV
jgi:hypothetical protein